MPVPLNHIVQQLFQQPALSAVSLHDLEVLVNKYPYFAAAQFLLLKKMQDSNNPAFQTQLHKTTIYFNNPLWLQFLLQPAANSDNGAAIEATQIIVSDRLQEEELPLSEIAVSPDSDERQLTPSTKQDQPDIAKEQVTMPDSIAVAFSDANPLYNIAAAEPSGWFAGDPEPNQLQAGLAEKTNQAEPAVDDDTATPLMSAIATQPDNETTAQTAISPQDAATGSAGVIAVDTTPTTEWSAIDDAGSKYRENALPEHLPAEQQQDIATAAAVEMEGGMQSSSIEADVKEGSSTPNKINENGDEQPILPATAMPAPDHNEQLFEPYHTVDYFASQGIKLSKIEHDSRDRLGRQLKSFTDWLKTMKKLPQASINQLMAENEESKVVADASHSLENKEVITEAMAEVFEKQGLQEKAADIYLKLSLLNPSKSAYFAAKIDVLKQ